MGRWAIESINWLLSRLCRSNRASICAAGTSPRAIRSMTSICWGLNGGVGNVRAAARMVVTLGTPELGEETLGAIPTTAGTYVTAAATKASRKEAGVTIGD